MPRVSWAPECPCAWMPKCPSVLRTYCPSARRVPECLKWPSALSASSDQVPFECLECPSAQVTCECLKCSSARVPWVPWVPWKPNSLGKSISHSASKSAGLQGWFIKLISTFRAHTIREDLILRLRKLDIISNSSFCK